MPKLTMRSYAAAEKNEEEMALKIGRGRLRFRVFQSFNYFNEMEKNRFI